MGTRLLLLTAAALAAVTLACGDDDAGDEEVPPADDLVQTLEVSVVDFAFEPDEFAARRGEPTEVVVANEGNAEHTFTIDEVGVDETISPGDQITVTFDAPQEETEFYCRFHSEMRGTLAIDPAEAPEIEDSPTGDDDEDSSDGAVPDETDDDDDDDDDENSGSDSDDSGSGGYSGY